MQIESPAFHHGAEIPIRFTGDGADVSPPLAWREVPANARTLVLIVDDPDAPRGGGGRHSWVHWLVYDIPVTTSGTSEARLPAGGRIGLNDWNRAQWDGPRPPTGKHRYFFSLFALDVELGKLTTPTKAAVLQAMEGHVVAEASMMGTYEHGLRRPSQVQPRGVTPRH